MLLRIVGLGPGDPDLLTFGSVNAMRAAGRAMTPLAPPELNTFLEERGVRVVREGIADPALFVRGSTDEIERFVEHLDGADMALGILGNPLSDFAGLPVLLRTLERRPEVSTASPGRSSCNALGRHQLAAGPIAGRLFPP